MVRALLLLSLLVTGATRAQDTIAPNHRTLLIETGLLVGGRMEIAREVGAPMSLVELGVAKAAYGGMHMMSMSTWASTEFGMRGDTPILAPKIGAQVSMLFSFGVELVYYTDLDQGTLHLVPSIGFAGYPLRIALEPHVRLVNTDFRPVEGGCVSIVYRLATLRRRER